MESDSAVSAVSAKDGGSARLTGEERVEICPAVPCLIARGTDRDSVAIVVAWWGNCVPHCCELEKDEP